VALSASYRGRVTTVSGTGTADSGPISVNAGDMLVVAVIADSYQDLTHASVTMTWPDSRGFTYWTEHAFWGNSYDGCYTQIAAYRCPAAGSPGIHVVTSGSAQGHRRPSFEIWTITGTDASNPAPWSDNRDAFGNPMNLTLHSVAGTAGDTIAIICGADGFSVGDPYVSGDGINPGNGYTQPSGGGEPGISGFSTAASWHTPDTNQSLVIDPPGGSLAVYAVSWMEFQASRAAPVVNAGADASYTFGSGGGTFTRTATESGGGVSSRQWTIQSGPAGAGTVIGTAAALSWSPTAAGVYVLRYSATNAFGTGTDDVTVTVVGAVPVVDAGLDRTVERTLGIIRTAGEASTGGSTITARQWRLMSGPAGSGAPVDLAAYQGDPQRCLLPSTVIGAHVIRYTATNATGPAYDEATITVTALRPVVNAGPDEARGMGTVTRTATEVAGDNAITSRRWYISAGPSGVGDTIGSAAALSWTPPSLGQWTLGYTATSAAGTSDPDTAVITVGITGVPLKLGRTPAPKIAVAVAFGGNLADPDGSDWVFTEVTTDVRTSAGIHVRHGRGDEASASQPAQVSLTLNNRHGRYSLGGRSPYWPNVRQGTPVQLSCDLGSGFTSIFTGYADGWTPNYSTRPEGAVAGVGDSTVVLVASGSLRRMAQGQPPVISPLRRGLASSTGVVAYWPCEDETGATLLASAFPGAPPMDFSGRLHGGSNPGLPAATPRLAQSDVFACSAPLPLVSDSEWYGNVPDYPGTEIIQLRCLIAVPAAGSINGSVILGMITTGDPGFWELRYMTGGLINVRAWRNFQSLVLDSPSVQLVPGPYGAGAGMVGIDGRSGQLGLTLTKSGGNIDWVVDFIEQGATVGYVYGPGMGGPTVAGASVGKAQRIQTATDGGHVDVTLGHIVVRKDSRDTAAHIKQLNAYRGEIVGERLARLRDENAMWYVQYDPPPPYYPIISDTMGPQPVGTVLDLFRDCETTDGGLLWDGRGPGLSYTTKRYRESPAPVLTLDAAAGEVGLPFEPKHDDAYRVNRAIAKRRGGASAVFEDATGPLGSTIVGRYEDSREFGVSSDTALPQYAGWMVGQGTAEGYRYPRLSLDLRAHPELLDEWLAVIPGDRVDVLNLSTIHPSAPTEAVSLVVEGYEQTIGPTTWTVIMNTSLASRWAVASVAAQTIGGAGDPRPEYVARVDSDNSTIAVLTAAGQSTLDVIVNAGPLWTTNTNPTTGDYPLYLDVGALRVRATSCTAGGVAGNPNRQTFTIDPMPVTRPAGVAVRLWQPAVYGL